MGCTATTTSTKTPLALGQVKLGVSMQKMSTNTWMGGTATTANSHFNHNQHRSLMASKGE
jgi:hypothetical protein